MKALKILIFSLFICGLLLPSLSSGNDITDNDWVCLGHDARHTNYSPVVAAQTHRLKYSLMLGSNCDFPIISSPIAASNIIVVPISSRLFVFDPQNPNLIKWGYVADDWITASPAMDNDTIYFGDMAGAYYALAIADGDIKWTFQAESYSFDGAVVSNENVYVVSSKKLYALDKTDGSLKWEYETVDDWINSAPSIDDDTLYLGCGKKLYCLNSADGSERWSYEGDSAVSHPAIDSDGTIYITTTSTLCAIDREGNKKWGYAIEEYVCFYAWPSIGREAIYIGDSNGKFYAISKGGNLKWYYETQGSIYFPAAIGGDETAYIPSSDGNLYAFGEGGSLKWVYGLGRGYNPSPSIGPDGTLYIGASGILYAFGDE